MLQFEDQGIWMSQNEVTFQQYEEIHALTRDLRDAGGNLEYISQWDALSQPSSGDANYVRTFDAAFVWLNGLSELERGDNEWVYFEGDEPYLNEQSRFEFTIKENNSGYRLPTVDEWMKACSAVDSGVPLNDMRGNLSELCWDESDDYVTLQGFRPVVACGGDFITGPLECVVSPNIVETALDQQTTGFRLVTKTRPSASSSQEKLIISGTSGIHTLDSGWVSLFVEPQAELKRDRFGNVMVVAEEDLEIKAGVENLSADEVTTQWYSKNNNQIGRRALGDIPLQDGGNISGAHTDRLTISNVTSAMNGNQYYAVVTPKDSGILPATTPIVTLQVADTPELKLGIATGIPDWRWASGGHAPFIYDGETYAETREDPVASSLVRGQQVTVIQTTVAGPGTLSFSWELTLPSGELLALKEQIRYELLVDGQAKASLAEVARVADPNDPLDQFKVPFIRNTDIEGIEIPAGTHRLMWSFGNTTPEGSAQVGALLYDVMFEGSGPPIIAVEPTSRLVLPLGDMAYYYVGATGENLEYQWSERFGFDFVPMENQLSPWLILPDHTAVAGPSSFKATVSNSLGTVDSGQAVLNVYGMEELERALDNTSLVWETGGDVPWYPDTDGSLARYDQDSAMSNEIGDLASSWIETEVTGPVTLAFDWSVSSERDFDFLRFFIDNEMQDAISGDLSWKDTENNAVMAFQTKQYQLPAGLHTVRWAFEKDPIDIDPTYNDQGYLDNVRLFAPEALKEALDDPLLVWETGGDAPWVPDYEFSQDGFDSARSGSILWDDATWIQTAVTGPGTLTFRWFIGAYSNPGTSDGPSLDFYIDAVLQRSRSGFQDWQEVSMEVPEGVHTMKWEYKKDQSPIGLFDAAWLDQVSFSKLVVVESPQITRQPESQTVSVGDQATFTVLATGVPEASYQWQKDGGAIDGAVQATYTVENAQLSRAGTYTAVVSDSLGSLVSAPAVLTVNPQPVTEQTTIFLTPSLFQLGDLFVGESGSGSFTVLNTGNADLNISSITSNLGNVLTVSETALTVSPRSAQDIAFTLSPAASGPIAGNLTIIANTPDSPIQIPFTGNAIARQQLLIVQQPVSRQVAAGGSVAFSVAATGAEPLSYQWQFNGQSISGATQVAYAIAQAETANAGTYTVVVGNSAGSITSDPALLTIETQSTQAFITPSTIGFGDVLVGQTSSKPVTILNIGQANLIIASVTSNLGDVLEIAETSLAVAQGSSHDLILTLSPVTPGAIAGTLSVTGNTADSPVLIPITGNALSGATPNTPPVVSPILDQVVDENSSSSAIAFTVSDQETSANQLVLSAISSNIGLIPAESIVFGGSGQNRTVTISPSANQTGFSIISINVGDGDLTSSVSFNVEVQATGPVLHPSDINPADNRISIAELTSYGTAWKEGDIWPLEPNPIPIAYVTRAGAIWKEGEVYKHDPGLGELPLSWVNEPVQLQSTDFASSRTTRTKLILSQSGAIRSLPSSFKPGWPVEVRIQVMPSAGNLSYAVEETLPDGWNVSEVNENGLFDSDAGKVRWGPFLDEKSRTLMFDIIPPEVGTGTYAFEGVVSFDGSNRAITGSTKTTARYLAARFLEHGSIELTVTGAPGDLFTLEMSSDLVHWSPFTSLQLDFELHRGSYQMPDGEFPHFLRAKRIGPEMYAPDVRSDELE